MYTGSIDGRSSLVKQVPLFEAVKWLHAGSSSPLDTLH